MSTNGWQDFLGQEGKGPPSDSLCSLSTSSFSTILLWEPLRAKSHSTPQIFPCLQDIWAQMELLHHRPISSPLETFYHIKQRAERSQCYRRLQNQRGASPALRILSKDLSVHIPFPFQPQRTCRFHRSSQAVSSPS